jgi:penicillin-binding protein 1C
VKTPQKNRRWLRWLKRSAFTLLAFFLAAWIGLKFVPVPESLLRTPPVSVEITDRNGKTLRETRVGERFRREVKYAEIPQNVIQAMLAAEDKRFFSHSGVDWLAAGRAAVSSAHEGRKTSGASTISQQLIKLSVPRPRTLATKLIEMATALRLEQIWTKEEILAAYLNRLDFGNLNFGVAEAAGYYFGKPLADLSNAEAALLAGLPWNPTRLNPHANPTAAKRRQETVLRRMHESGWLSQEEFDRAIAEPLRYEKARRVFNAPHFVDLVLQHTKDELAVATRENGEDLNLEVRKSGNGEGVISASDESQKPSWLPGFQIQTLSAGEIPASFHQHLQGEVRTTLDLDLNRFVERSVTERLASLRAQNVRDAAAVVLDNRTGEVLALVGSENYFAPGSGMVNGATEPRSAGSTIKPITYLLAMERGATPSTIVPDVPTEFPTPTGPYRPENYHRHCQGPVRYREALACSLNIPAVRVLQSLGGAAILQRRLQAWGVTTLPKQPDEYGLGLTIGNAEVRLLELANLYATLARMGEWRPYRLLNLECASPLALSQPRIQSGRGLPQSKGGAPDAQAGAPRAELCWLIADMLSDNAARVPAFGANSALRFDFPVACKTGTSTDFRDNWTVGYTPEFTVGVWVGNFNGAPMREVSGVTGAAPIMHDVMEHLHRRFGTTWFERPPGIVERAVHPLTGRLLPVPRADAVMEKFTVGNLPPAERAKDYDANGHVKLGAEYSEWAASVDNQLRDRVALEDAGRLHLVSPQPGSTFLLDPDVPSSGLVPLVVSGSGRLIWESRTLSLRERAGRMFAVAVEGRHELTARDSESGQTVTTWVMVKAL